MHFWMHKPVSLLLNFQLSICLGKQRHNNSMAVTWYWFQASTVKVTYHAWWFLCSWSGLAAKLHCCYIGQAKHDIKSNLKVQTGVLRYALHDTGADASQLCQWSGGVSPVHSGTWSTLQPNIDLALLQCDQSSGVCCSQCCWLNQAWPTLQSRNAALNEIAM